MWLRDSSANDIIRYLEKNSLSAEAKEDLIGQIRSYVNPIASKVNVNDVNPMVAANEGTDVGTSFFVYEQLHMMIVR